MMQFRVSAVGDDLVMPVTAEVTGALEDALRMAESILEREPHCEAVEIFRGRRFLRDVARR